ncbi:MAG: T9SS type A sorting domain-containing protein, partial [Calditrichaeota bacterium]|nr:T9SS type A sorting domain-containing protein [Calditrichota bacterium]
NYPNPFNATTTITFTVKETNITSLKVYNILGQEVATLFQGTAQPGQYYKIGFDASALASGIYVYRLQSGTDSDLKKMCLMK